MSSFNFVTAGIVDFLKIIMHRDITLFAVKSSNKLNYLKLEERN